MPILDDLLGLLGMSQGQTVARKPGVSYGRSAMSRIGRTPIEFLDTPMIGNGLAGEYDPNVPGGAIQIAVGEGRSPRQIERTLAHEDMHSIFEQQGQEDVTHKMLANPQQPDTSLIEGRGLDDIEKLLRMFMNSDRQ